MIAICTKKHSALCIERVNNHNWSKPHEKKAHHSKCPYCAYELGWIEAKRGDYCIAERFKISGLPQRQPSITTEIDPIDAYTCGWADFYGRMRESPFTD